jgi:carboxylate-amine ligase
VPLHLFQAYGVELEYMIVDKDTLRVRPIADLLLKEAATLPGAEFETDGDPEYPNEVALGDIAWSNELTLHVIELKTFGPASSLDQLAAKFASHVARINALLAPHNAMLLPGGMHPTMNPDTEMKLWPHDYGPVYATFNRIFDCRGHGWANLQAAHLNLPFQGDSTPDSEFGRLHAAIRMLLPIMPALSASTPVMDGKKTGVLDNRLEVYRTNSRAIPAAAGLVIPEPVFTRADYERVIFAEIYRQYAPHDPDGVLRHEWANSRGAIARFTRDTIEVRVLDVQECPKADLAITAAISAALRAITEGRLGSLASMRRWSVEPLHDILLDVIKDADKTVIRNTDYARELGFTGAACTAGDLWRHLLEQTLALEPAWSEHSAALHTILDQGCLARRILRAMGGNTTRHAIDSVCRELAASLARNQLFGA